MTQSLLSRFLRWKHQQAEKQRMRQRNGVLQGRLAQLDKDIAEMSHFPEPVQKRMRLQRERLLAQIETAKKFA